MTTTISWTDDTWNPTDGCECVSPGCANCYAMRFAGRFSKPGERYHGLVTIAKNKRAVWTGEGRLDLGKLTKPLGWKKPRRIFVNSMSDLFFERFTNEEIAAVFGVMAACPQHTFQILTKRAARMREWFEWIASTADINGTMHVEAGPYIADAIGDDDVECEDDDPAIVAGHAICDAEWPLPNVWLGVSVENQEAADERIPELLRTPATVRFLSCEPLLGPIDLGLPRTWLVGATARRILRDAGGDPAAVPAHLRPPTSLDWVIAGCESGPGSRSCDVAWLRALRDQCASAGVAFFAKQAVATDEERCEECRERVRYYAHSPTLADARCGCTVEGPEACDPPAIAEGADSKRKGGGVIELPYLDGIQHAQFPEVTRG